MPKTKGLSDKECRNAQCPSGKNERKLFDRHGLYLLVKANGSKYWHHKFSLHGKPSVISYGVYPEISLANA